MTGNEQILAGLLEVNPLIAMTEYEDGVVFQGTLKQPYGTERFIPKNQPLNAPAKTHIRFATFNSDGFSLKTLYYETTDPNDTLAKIFTAILNDKTLSDNAKHALIELMRVAYEEVVSG